MWIAPNARPVSVRVLLRFPVRHPFFLHGCRRSLTRGSLNCPAEDCVVGQFLQGLI